MKGRLIGYWVTTAIVAFVLLVGGVMDLVRPADAVELIAHLGYPMYFMTIIGFWKVLGAFAVVIPGAPRLKEWAYAGIVFDFTGALVSHAAIGDGAGRIIPPLVLTLLALASWVLRPQSRVLGAIFHA
jgi:uncharacterized membrane protein YphA (DoxX/SURF4 family)